MILRFVCCGTCLRRTHYDNLVRLCPSCARGTCCSPASHQAASGGRNLWLRCHCCKRVLSCLRGAVSDGSATVQQQTRTARKTSRGQGSLLLGRQASCSTSGSRDTALRPGGACVIARAARPTASSARPPPRASEGIGTRRLSVLPGRCPGTLRPRHRISRTRPRPEPPGGCSVKRTYQPHNRRRARRHGFRHRMSSRAGRAIVNARRRKGRQRLSA